MSGRFPGNVTRMSWPHLVDLVVKHKWALPASEEWRHDERVASSLRVERWPKILENHCSNVQDELPMTWLSVIQDSISSTTNIPARQGSMIPKKEMLCSFGWQTMPAAKRVVK